jgi:DNA-directed RNA polymerase specialized sigma24 family protein
LKRRRQFWEASIKKHYDKMLTFARRFTNGDESRAKGLVQRVALRIFSQNPKVLSDQATLPYLRTAIKNIWIDNRQRREMVSLDQETEAFFQSLEIPVEPATQKNLEQSEIAARVLQEMEPDNPELPLLLQLKLEGRTLIEID